MIPDGGDSPVRVAQASAWNIANALTVLRLALVPVFAWFLLYDDGRTTSHRLIAAGVFTVATATDRIDGDIARAKGIVTDFGKVSDPIADKALMGMGLIGLSIIGLLPWWVTAIIVVREVAVTALRFVVIRHGVMPASRGGKVKTALQALAILLYVLPLNDFWHSIAFLVMAVAVIVTVATGVDYVMRADTLRHTSPRALAARERRAANAEAKAAAAVAKAAVGQAAVVHAEKAAVATAKSPVAEAKAKAAVTKAATPDATALNTAGPEV